jgi:hypothetical protein
MKRLLPTVILSLLVATSAIADTSEGLRPVYADAGQYSASLDRESHLWRLAPIVGETVEVRPAELCPSTTRPAPGLWLVGRDAEGRPELIAPSATLLPAGHSGRVALRACDDPALREAGVDAYGVPGLVLEWLTDQAGAVMVDD